MISPISQDLSHFHHDHQGFNSHEMTAILATNVIHATMHLASTMATIHVLLQPGGHIVFNEVQNPGTLGEDGVGRGWGMDGWGMVGGKGGGDDADADADADADDDDDDDDDDLFLANLDCLKLPKCYLLFLLCTDITATPWH